jgi:hypothetical protein
MQAHHLLCLMIFMHRPEAHVDGANTIQGCQRFVKEKKKVIQQYEYQTKYRVILHLAKFEQEEQKNYIKVWPS